MICENLRKGIALMLGSSLCVCFGQLLWKLSVTNGWAYMLAGFFLYGVGAVLMITAYKYGKVSVLQPILSINYVLSLIIAIWILNEALSLTKIIGAIVITFGVCLIACSDKDEILSEGEKE